MNYQDAREFHDAIDQAIKGGRGNLGVLRAMLPAAKAKLDFHAKRLVEFQAALARVHEMPVEDCEEQQQPPPNPPPAEPISQPEYEPVPPLPALDRFCSEEEKQKTIELLRAGGDAARRNYDRAAAKVVELGDRIAKGDQSATTGAAFQEASDAASKWIRQAWEFDAALTRAEAMAVSDCNQPREDRRTALNDATPVNPADIVVAPRDETSQVFGAESAGGTIPAGGQDDDLEQELRDVLFAGAPGDGVPRAAEVEMYLLATGGSTGPVVQLFAVNRTGEAVQLRADFLVLEPVQISPETQARVGALLQSIIDRGGRPQTINAYCLEFLRQPPAEGTVLRIANAGTSSRFAQLKGILDAAKRLHDAGILSPDSDPAQYFHAIRQWAIWTVQERFDLGGFEEAFVRTARKSYADAGDAWTAAIEEGVRALVPNRWKNIRAVLLEAGLLQP
jgi:hypothetical protein